MKNITRKDIIKFIQREPCLVTMPDGFRPYYAVGYSKENGLCHVTEKISDFAAYADLDTSDKEWYPEPTGEETMDYFYSAEVEENPAFMDCVREICMKINSFIDGEEDE